MKVKTFHALSMQDALRQIKQEMGPDAIILSSKEVWDGGRPLRVFDRPVLEVMAACEEPAASPTAPPRDESQREEPRQTEAVPSNRSTAAPDFRSVLRSALEPGATLLAKRGTRSGRAVGSGVEWRRKRLQHLRTELGEVSRLLGQTLLQDTQPTFSSSVTMLDRLCGSFVRQGMHLSSAESLGTNLRRRVEEADANNEDAIVRALGQEIASRIPVQGDSLGQLNGRAVCLILGPSGVGKTLSVAKLAARCRLKQRSAVAVVTFDACREVSVEQLRRYARTLGVPFALARSPRQLREGLRRYGKARLVLVDMPGVRHDDVTAAVELHRMLSEGWEVAAHLALPAFARARELCAIVDRAKVLPSLHLLFTKLDETESFGTLYEVAHQTGLPLSYWGVGQRVPEDIEPASPLRLAELLIAQRYVARHDVPCPALNGSVNGSEAGRELASVGPIFHFMT